MLTAGGEAGSTSRMSAGMGAPGPEAGALGGGMPRSRGLLPHLNQGLLARTSELLVRQASCFWGEALSYTPLMVSTQASSLRGSWQCQ